MVSPAYGGYSYLFMNATFCVIDGCYSRMVLCIDTQCRAIRYLISQVRVYPRYIIFNFTNTAVLYGNDYKNVKQRTTTYLPVYFSFEPSPPLLFSVSSSKRRVSRQPC
jgi:hypothetical protein